MNLEREAVKITEELGEVVFIGALAVNHYSRFRGTKDIDLVMAAPLDEKRLSELKYIKKRGSRASWYTPRGIQADFYTRDVGGILGEWILKNAVTVEKGAKSFKVICLEGLILAKYRAGRTQDVADLQELMKHCSQRISWNIMSSISTDIEVAELRKVAKVFEQA